jgi:regulator of protease activity HflC (stomatin/prohibitin superfamily)
MPRVSPAAAPHLHMHASPIASRWGVLTIAALVAACAGCSGAMIAPGHRGLAFDPKRGLQHEVLQPGYYRLPGGAHIDDFDVTYTSKPETLHGLTVEALPIEVHARVIYRPIVAELYLLDTEIGPDYYAEVIGPELRSSFLATLARHSYVDLAKKPDGIEDEVEAAVRERLRGRHVEISSVAIESIDVSPELAAAVRDRILRAERAEREKLASERASLCGTLAR